MDEFARITICSVKTVDHGLRLFFIYGELRECPWGERWWKLFFCCNPLDAEGERSTPPLHYVADGCVVGCSLHIVGCAQSVRLNGSEFNDGRDQCFKRRSYVIEIVVWRSKCGNSKVGIPQIPPTGFALHVIWKTIFFPILRAKGLRTLQLQEKTKSKLYLAVPRLAFFKFAFAFIISAHATPPFEMPDNTWTRFPNLP